MNSYAFASRLVGAIRPSQWSPMICRMASTHRRVKKVIRRRLPKPGKQNNELGHQKSDNPLLVRYGNKIWSIPKLDDETS